jgi:DNA-binding XRE family transcriptional regulator
MRDWLERRRVAAQLDGVDLAGVRQACGVTQQTLADGLGVGRPAVAHWEKRTRRPPESYCRVVAGFLRHLEVARGGDQSEDSEKRGISHFATCPQAADWRSR